MEEIEKIVLSPTAKDNGLMFVPPHGYEVEKADIVDGKVFVTLKAKEMQLPKTWEEFCELNPRNENEFHISSLSTILRESEDELHEWDREIKADRNVLPNRETAEAVLALCQLIQLRDCYNDGWVPIWKGFCEKKYLIQFIDNELSAINTDTNASNSMLYFKTEELRDQFLENFRDLIEKLKPLYGIK